MFGSRSTPNLSSPTVPTRKIFGNTSDENWRHELSRRGAEVVCRTLEVEHTVRTSPVSNNRMKTRAAIAAAEAARNPISGVGHQTTVPRAGNLESHKWKHRTGSVANAALDRLSRRPASSRSCLRSSSPQPLPTYRRSFLTNT